MTRPVEDTLPADTGTYLLPMRREQFLHFLPKKARVAEIGVAQGNFAREILFRTRPRHLSLIDCWDMIDNSDRDDDADIPQSMQDRRYASVKRFFAFFGWLSRIDVIKAWSKDAAEQTANEEFDWVYVDGDHDEEAVLSDLEAWLPKLKADGFLLGHDFAPFSRKHHGVIRAVRRFLDAHPETRLMAITGEQYATFVIAKDGSSQRARDLTQSIKKRVHFKLLLDHDTVFSLRQERFRSKRLVRSATFFIDRDNPDF